MGGNIREMIRLIYKQARNSIVVDVLMAIFENMFINECETNTLF